MDIFEILKSGLAQFDANLGDRKEYIGASDVGQCPRKAVLTKLEEPGYDLATLIRFIRGHLAEGLLKIAFQKNKRNLPQWEYQKEIPHQNKPFKAHTDFVFKTKEVIAVLEVKSISGIPAMPYDGWLQQLHFQMGLLQEKYPKKHVKGAIFAIDLNEGQTGLFNGYAYNSQIYEGLLLKADHIWKAVNGQVEPQTEKGPLCAWCHYRPGCGAFAVDEDVPEMPLESELREYLGLKETRKKINDEINKLLDCLKTAANNANPDQKKTRVRDQVFMLSSKTRRNVDFQGLKLDHPEIYHQYVTETSYEVPVVN